MKKKTPLASPFQCKNCHVFSLSIFKSHRVDKIDAALAGRRQPFRFGKRDVIFREGEVADGVYCLYSGYVKIVKRDRRRHEHVVGLLKPGDALGVESLVGQPSYSNSAVAMNEAELCFIPKADFLNVMSKDASLFEEMLRFLCQRLDSIENQLTNIGSGNCRERLAAMLLALKSLCGETDRFLNISLSVDDLADLLGTTRSSVYRLMKEFKDAALVTMKSNRIQILSERGLSELSTFRISS